MNQKNFIVDVDKCTGCNLCVVACKDEHVDSSYIPWSKSQPEGGHFWMNVKAVERGTIPRVRMSFLPIMCQHCEDAPCITACPEGAIKTRDDGLIWIDGEKCTGCGDCQPACPYDVIYKNDDLNIAQKCTGCAHRLDKRELPRCVDVCPHEAILFDQADARDSSLEFLHPEHEAKPRVFWRGLPKPWITGAIINAKADEVVIGACVTATNLTDGTTLKTRSNEFGEFWLTDLLPNNAHRVDIVADGYSDFSTRVLLNKEQDIGLIELTTAV